MEMQMNLKDMKVGQVLSAAPKNKFDAFEKVAKNSADWNSNAVNIANAFLKLGFKGAISDSGKGQASYRGIKFDFHTTGENLYITLPEVSTKDAPEETIKSLKSFLDVISNF
jgi:hypothetical protein